jgi:hypothetical protein
VIAGQYVHACAPINQKSQDAYQSQIFGTLIKTVSGQNKQRTSASISKPERFITLAGLLNAAGCHQ